MPDLKTWLRPIGEMDAPDLWQEGLRRADEPPSRLPTRGQSLKAPAILVAAALILGGVLFALSGLGHNSTQPGSDGVPRSLFIGPTINGGEITAQEVEGKVLVVGTWSSFCLACKSSLKTLDAVARANKGDLNVAVIGLDVNDNPQPPAVQFAAEFGGNFPSIAVDQATLGEILSVPVNETYVPGTYVIDQGGKIRASIPTNLVNTTEAQIQQQASQIQSALDSVLQAPSPGQVAGEVAGEVVQQTIVIRPAVEGNGPTVFAPPPPDSLDQALTADEALQAFKVVDPQYTAADGATALLGSYTAPSGPDAYRFQDRLAWGYKTTTTCPPSPNPFDSQSPPGDCTAWLFLDARTAKMLEAMDVPIS